MKTLLQGLLVSAMVLSTLSATSTTFAVEPDKEIKISQDVLTSGSCGENATYTFDSTTGTLTISGTGAIYDDSYSTPKPWNSWEETIKNIVIQQGITEIGNNIFRGCTSLTSVSLPSGLTRIGEMAFYMCESLAEISLPQGLQTLEDNAFASCIGLTQISIPSTVTHLGGGVFSNCTSLVSAAVNCPIQWEKSSSLERNGYALFQSCYSLTTVHLAEGINRIQSKMFGHCTALTTINIPNSVTYIEYTAFDHCEQLTSVYLPKSLQSMSGSAFDMCYGLSTIYYPGTMEEFSQIKIESEDSYSDNTSRVHFDNATVIPNSTTAQAQSFPETITNGLKVVKNTVVEYVGTGGDVVIPAEVNGQPILKIAENAFYDCATITSVHIPDSVEFLEWKAFGNCTSLSSVRLPQNLKELDFGTFRGCSALTSVVVPDGLVSIGNFVFEECTSLKTVYLPSSLEWISGSAFNPTPNLETVYFGGTEAERNVIINSKFNYGGLSSAPWVYNSSISSMGNAPTPEPSTPVAPTPSVSTSKIATPSTAKVMVNGTEVPFGAYNIDGYNYFKLTDISFSIFGTAKQFRVSWDAEKNAINMLLGEAHSVLGTEMQGNSGKNELADLFTSPIYCNGTQVKPTVYVIDGSSYFQLASLVEIIGITVGWDGDTSTITIST